MNQYTPGIAETANEEAMRKADEIIIATQHGDLEDFFESFNDENGNMDIEAMRSYFGEQARIARAYLNERKG